MPLWRLGRWANRGVLYYLFQRNRRTSTRKQSATPNRERPLVVCIGKNYWKNLQGFGFVAVICNCENYISTSNPYKTCCWGVRL